MVIIIMNKFNEFTFCVNNEFKKKLSSLKKYCPQAYKYFIFELKKDGYFNKYKNGIFEINLPTSSEFKFVYGQIRLKFYVHNKVAIFLDLEPSDFFIDGYKFDLDIYKSVYYRDIRDKFKIDLMFELKKGGMKDE